jgi:hypothetical protein
VTAGTTLVKAIHVTYLRAAADSLRALTDSAGLGFTDPDGLLIKRIHLTEIRDKFDRVRWFFGMPPIAYTDPAITAGVTKVKAAHINQLRTASH